MLSFVTYFCIGNYLLATLGGFCQLRGISQSRIYILLFAWIAVLTHGTLLYWAIETGVGQNLDIVNVLSLISWLISLLVVVTSLTKQVEVLGTFIFPFAALSVFLEWLFPGQVILHTRENLLQLIHILSSLLAVSVIGLSAVQAAALAIQVRRLRGHASSKLLRVLLPLETLESLLFSTIWLGFLLLSVSMLTGLIYWAADRNLQILWKVIFVIIAWAIFAMLLFGRYAIGWRGTHAINWTLLGLLFLLVAYIGTHLWGYLV